MQTVIDTLADRIERAYRLRRPDWDGVCSTPRVWTAAAALLFDAREGDDLLPIDPELFVRAQPMESPYPDPWRELTDPAALTRYRHGVETIVSRLRAELAREVGRAERQIGAGQPIGKVLSSKSGWLSALGRLIVARRAGRFALARRFFPDAVTQHQSCPLYRLASLNLLPAEDYPVPAGAEPSAAPPLYASDARTRVHLN